MATDPFASVDKIPEYAEENESPGNEEWDRSHLKDEKNVDNYRPDLNPGVEGGAEERSVTMDLALSHNDDGDIDGDEEEEHHGRGGLDQILKVQKEDDADHERRGGEYGYDRGIGLGWILLKKAGRRLSELIAIGDR